MHYLGNGFRVLLISLVGFGGPAWGARRIQTTSFLLHQNIYASANSMVMRVSVEVVNISNFEQRVKIQMRDITVAQGIGLANGPTLSGEALGDMHYSAWVKNGVYKHVRSRHLTVPDITDLAELTVQANTKRYLKFSVVCLINNVSETAYDCSRSEVDASVVGYVVPFPLSRVEGSAGGRFEITTAGPNMDRGALLGSYSVSLLFGLETQEITREMNGGRPF